MVVSAVVDEGLDQGAWLLAHHWEMEQGEAVWLDMLADFDQTQGWYRDGQLSCVEWLMFQTKMSRPTAFEKLRIAHELRRRPVLADAYRAGRVSYSAVRVLTRLQDPDPDVDRTLIKVAESGTMADVERVARLYRLHAEQHCPPRDPGTLRSLHVRPMGDGTSRVEITLTEVEAAELTAALRAGLDLSYRDNRATGPVDNPVEESPAGDWTDDRYVTFHEPSRRADAFMDLVHVALAHLDDGRAAGDDRYLVHLVTVADGTTTLADGTPLDQQTAGRVACDSATVTHHHDTAGEPLFLGRKTRTWNHAQRRAALVRDGGHCRFPGCSRRVADLHHQQYWSQGGPTNIDNGFLVCPHHHTLLHHGYRATGSPNHLLSFYRPDGLLVGTTTPTQRAGP